MRQEQQLVGLELAGSIASGSGPVSCQGNGAQGGKKKFKELYGSPMEGSGELNCAYVKLAK